MELMTLSMFMVAWFGLGWIVGHAMGYEKGINEWPR